MAAASAPTVVRGAMFHATPATMAPPMTLTWPSSDQVATDEPGTARDQHLHDCLHWIHRRSPVGFARGAVSEDSRSARLPRTRNGTIASSSTA